jgi:phosphoserine phosphatase RsbX
MREQGSTDLLDWAVATRPMPGEEVSGDEAIVLDDGGSSLLAVIDGIGHGPKAATAAHRAAAALAKHPSEPIEALFVLCHEALADTRGAAMTIALVGCESASLRWLGVGNVTGTLLRVTSSGPVAVSATLLRGGIVGYQLPTLQVPEAVALMPMDTLILVTDGIRAEFDETLNSEQPVDVLAGDILARWAIETDDALVLAARHRGAAS